MITLYRISYGASGKERTSQKRCLAALFLNHRQINMQRKGVLGMKAEGIHNTQHFFLLRYLKYQLPCLTLLRKHIES
jgi:hypothetical protein